VREIREMLVIAYVPPEVWRAAPVPVAAEDRALLREALLDRGWEDFDGVSGDEFVAAIYAARAVSGDGERRAGGGRGDVGLHLVGAE
jgi:hypothetical protein